MKYIVISDIHGGIENLIKVLDIYKNIGCKKLIILGDLFDYGIDYNREKIINTLNKFKENILCVRGNCDKYIEGVSFEMPYVLNIDINGHNFLLTHGHLYDTQYLLNSPNDIILTGHTHKSEIKKINDKLFLNPGSIAKSRKGPNSFILITESDITIRTLNNDIIETYIF